MTVITGSHHVRSEYGDVKVETDHGDVLVRWYCGEHRRFTPKALGNAIDHLKLLKDHSDAVMVIYDKHGNPVRLSLDVDGDLLRANGATPVHFGELRKAIKATCKAMK